MTENKRFQIIHLGNPYDFVVKDHQTNKTYGTLQGDDKSLMELLNGLAEENKVLRSDRNYWKTLAQSLAKNNGNVKLKDEHLAWKRVDVE